MNKVQEKPKRSVLVFSTRSYPTFGRKRKPFDEANPPDTVTDSPYYWWFMFLRLNKDYQATCKAKGKGKCSKLYEDFGDIYSMNFKEWWNLKAPLFSEPKKGYRFMIAKSMSDIAPFDSDQVLNLVVPLTWSQRSLKKAFTLAVLSKVEKGKRGISLEVSEAQYKLGSRWHIEAMKTAYKIYIEKNQPSPNGKKTPWADIAIKTKLPMSLGVKEGVKNRLNVDIRATLVVLAKRHYDRAERFIEAAATNSFPK